MTSGALAQNAKPVMDITIGSGNDAVVVGVMEAVHVQVKHGLQERDLKNLEGKTMSDPKTKATLLPHIKKLLGSNYNAFSKQVNINSIGPFSWNERIGGLVGYVASKNEDEFAYPGWDKVVFWFEIDSGEVRAAVYETIAVSVSEERAEFRARCTDYGMVNPGYLCERAF